MSLAHAAEHSFVEHDHNGHVCEIYFNADKTKYCDITDANIILHELSYVIASETIRYVYFIGNSSNDYFLSRAPPYFS